MFWVKPATRFLKKYLKAHPVDAMITSGPPHSVHLIGRNIKRSTGLPWISDFRDPWTNIDFYDQLMLSSWADRKHHRLEKQVLTEADKVTTVTWSLADELRELGGKDHVEVITNGFDHADFEHIDTQPAAEFLISHIGSINKDRNAPELWQAIAKLCLENQAFADAVRLRFIGKTDGALRADIETTGLSDKVSYIEYLPHKEIPERLRESQVLLLLLNDTPNVRGIAPGKMYEYLASGRPILATGPSDGDAARIISQANAGTMCDFGDQEAMEKVLLGFFERYQQGRLSVSHNDINRYSRKHTTGQMAALLDDLTA
jgi:glycosyltransferase involved in cell wall biosynthesis